MTNAIFDALSDEYRAYCAAQDLPETDAESLALDLWDMPDTPRRAAHIRWVSNFIRRWEAAEDLYRIAEPAS